MTGRWLILFGSFVVCLAWLGRHWPGLARAESASSDVRGALLGQRYKAARCAIPHDGRRQSFPGGCVDQNRPGLIRQVIAEPIGHGDAGGDGHRLGWHLEQIVQPLINSGIGLL